MKYKLNRRFFEHQLMLRIIVVSLITFVVFTNSSIAQSKEKNTKVILISVDGAADWIVDDLLARNVIPANGAFAMIQRKGFVAEKMIPVNVAATAVSHTSIFTGANPGKTGVIGNNFLKPKDTIKGLRATSGFNTPIEAETLWNALKRQGKRVTTVNAVGTDSSQENRRGTNTLSYGVKLANSNVVKFSPPSGPERMVLKKEGIEHLARVQPNSKMAYTLLKSKKQIPFYSYAIDRQIDGRINYDGILLDFDLDLSNGHTGILNKEQWSEIRFNVENQSVASWCYLKDLDPKGQGELYVGAIGFNPGYPQDFESYLQTEVGLWPCEQDNRMLSKGLITEKMWFEQVERQADYYQRLILASIKKGNWDLLMGYMNLVDDVQHRYFLKHPRQLEYNLENGERRALYNNYVEWAYKKVDGFLLEIIKNASKDVNVVVFSDHGMAATHSILLLNNYLASLGYKVTARNNEVRAYTTGPAAHIYVNLQGRNANGTVSQSKYNVMIDKIAKALKELKDPKTKESIFNVVLNRNEMKEYGLCHPLNSGDIFVSTNIGWSLSSKIVPEIGYIVPNAFKKDAYQHLDIKIQDFLSKGFMNETGLGVHGHIGTEREMHAIFYAIGPQIPNAVSGTVEALGIAPTVTDLFQIEPPKNAEGKSILIAHNP